MDGYRKNPFGKEGSGLPLPASPGVPYKTVYFPSEEGEPFKGGSCCVRRRGDEAHEMILENCNLQKETLISSISEAAILLAGFLPKDFVPMLRKNVFIYPYNASYYE